MKKRKTLIMMLSLVCLLVVGIGFATMTHNFTITGTATVTPAGFDVNFVANGTESYTVSNNGKTANVTVSGLSAVGSTATVKVKIENASTDYTAKITAITVDPVKVEGVESTDLTITTTTASEAAPITIAAKSGDVNGSTIIDVTFTVAKAQLVSNTFSFNVTFTATAVPV